MSGCPSLEGSRGPGKWSPWWDKLEAATPTTESAWIGDQASPTLLGKVQPLTSHPHPLTGRPENPADSSPTEGLWGSWPPTGLPATGAGPPGPSHSAIPRPGCVPSLWHPVPALPDPRSRPSLRPLPTLRCSDLAMGLSRNGGQGTVWELRRLALLSLSLCHPQPPPHRAGLCQGSRLARPQQQQGPSCLPQPSSLHLRISQSLLPALAWSSLETPARCSWRPHIASLMKYSWAFLSLDIKPSSAPHTTEREPASQRAQEGVGARPAPPPVPTLAAHCASCDSDGASASLLLC